MNATFNTPRIRYLFQDWIKFDWGAESAPWRSFDVGTPAGLWNWLYWMSNALAERRAQQPRLDRMQAQYPAPDITPKQVFG